MPINNESVVSEVIDGRTSVYGDPVETFARIAQVWSGILGHTINATDVPLCLIGLKLIRTVEAPTYSDNSDDIEGYLDIFRKIVGPDMIHARSVKEYVAQRDERERVKTEQQDPLEFQVFVVSPPVESNSRPADTYDVVVGGTGIDVVSSVPYAEAIATAAELNATLAYQHERYRTSEVPK